jgi:hypothetical protein
LLEEAKENNFIVNICNSKYNKKEDIK